MGDDAHVTVAVTDSQPEAAVLLSFLAWHGIPAYALCRHAAVSWTFVMALGGIPVRVPADCLAEAQLLLAEVAARPPVVRTRLIANPVLNAVALVGHMLLGGGAPPPRTRSTFRPGYSAATSSPATEAGSSSIG